MELKIDVEKLAPSDRTLVVQFTNALRDLDTIALLAKSKTLLSKAAKRKLWDSVKKNTEQPISDSFKVLQQLTNSADSDLRRLAEQSIDKNSGAMDELRRLGKRIKQL
jgi:hypothetical protein